jgi:hypothetical protein
VTHEFLLQVFYSVDGETVAGAPIDGPGELRMMAVKVPIVVPSVRPLVSFVSVYVLTDAVLLYCFYSQSPYMSVLLVHFRFRPANIL